MKLNIFCANCQLETPHEVVSNKAEIVTTCTNLLDSVVCGRVLKFHAMPIADFKSLLVKHAEDNKGQIKMTPEMEAEAHAGDEMLAALEEAGMVSKE